MMKEGHQRLSMPTPSGFLQDTLQRSIDIVAFGLHAADQLKPENLTLPGSFWQFLPAHNRQLTIEQTRSEFRTWVLGNGLRDCVDALGPTLEWARKQCVIWAQPGIITRLEGGNLRLSSEMNGSGWNSDIVTGARKFDRLPLPTKLQQLEQRYALGRPKLADAILSINAARNCLVHRMGIVAANDLNESRDSGFIVHWKKPTLRVAGAQGERIIDGPANVEVGEEVGVFFTDVSRTFALGERVILSASDYVDIAFTFFLFGKQIETSIRCMQEQRHKEQNDS